MSAAGSKTCIAPDASDLIARVEHVARTTSRPVTPLRLQSLLQLPRIADESGLASLSLVDSLLRELALELSPSHEWAVDESVGSSPRSLRFHEVAQEEGAEIMERFHYLRSARVDGRAYGLSSEAGRLIALCISSPLDVERLADLLRQEHRVVKTARVVSRVFAFEGAPSNTISYLLSRAARAERRFGVTDWVTYVNPNMGFSGVSYMASGWHLLGEEPGTTYRYLDNRYITDRKLAAKFGPHDDEGYRQLLGSRFAKSRMPLAPLLVFSQHFSKSMPGHERHNQG